MCLIFQEHKLHSITTVVCAELSFIDPKAPSDFELIYVNWDSNPIFIFVARILKLSTCKILCGVD